MHKVYCDIVDGEHFAGADFSKADAYIAQAAASSLAPHGNGKVWRQVNTTHHLTQVVSDIAAVRRIEIGRQKHDKVEQLNFLG